MARRDGHKDAAMKAFARLKLFVLLLWPASLWAAPMVIEQSFDSVPGVAWLVAAGLSTLGGVTAFMYRLAQRFENPESPPIKHLWLQWFSQMLCSWFAGSIVFLLGLHWEWPLFLVAACVAIGSFGGAKVVQELSERLVNKIGEKLP